MTYTIGSGPSLLTAELLAPYTLLRRACTGSDIRRLRGESILRRSSREKAYSTMLKVSYAIEIRGLSSRRRWNSTSL